MRRTRRRFQSRLHGLFHPVLLSRRRGGTCVANSAGCANSVQGALCPDDTTCCQWQRQSVDAGGQCVAASRCTNDNTLTKGILGCNDASGQVCCTNPMLDVSCTNQGGTCEVGVATDNNSPSGVLSGQTHVLAIPL